MKSSGPIIVATIVVAMVAAIALTTRSWLASEHQVASRVQSDAQAPDWLQGSNEQLHRATPVVARQRKVESTSIDYGAVFDSGTDLLPFYDLLRMHAARGDPESQYWLGAVIHRCGNEYPQIFFTAEDPDPSLDEVMERRQSPRDPDAEELRRMQDQCANLFRRGIENRDTWRAWIERAEAGGYPLAQATHAARNVGMAKAFEVTDQKSVSELKSLAIKSLRSGDPEVVRELAVFAAVFSFDPAEAEESRSAMAHKAQLSWTLAACLRGAECSQKAWWVRSACRRDIQCQPFETAADLMRRKSGSSFGEIEARARELNQLIDEQRWDDIDFSR